MEIRCTRYPVQAGEPQLGSYEECVYTFDDDEIREALIEKLVETSGDVDAETIFTIGGYEHRVGDVLEGDDILDLQRLLEQELLDDDYGTQREVNLITSFVNELEQDMAIEIVGGHDIHYQYGSRTCSHVRSMVYAIGII
jgi:hypothetical protein